MVVKITQVSKACKRLREQWLVHRKCLIKVNNYHPHITDAEIEEQRDKNNFHRVKSKQIT